MIEHYSFGSITILGKRYNSDLKIINGHVKPDWWRKSGHSVEVDDVTDILNATPEYLIIGTGSSGLMQLGGKLKQHLIDSEIDVVEESTALAIQTFNHMHAEGKNVAAAFHLTC